ncbi:hypothetical protein FSHL1_003792 [Fusarium sambucinum]
MTHAGQRYLTAPSEVIRCESPLLHNTGPSPSVSGSDLERSISTGDQHQNAYFIRSPTTHNNSDSYYALLMSQGQWHCMTNSFQRCAEGHWSMKMNMAEGTKCVPAGYTDDFNFRIEHEGNDHDNEEDRSDENRSNGGASLGARNSNSLIAIAVISFLWAVLGVIA